MSALKSFGHWLAHQGVRVTKIISVIATLVVIGLLGVNFFFFNNPYTTSSLQYEVVNIISLALFAGVVAFMFLLPFWGKDKKIRFVIALVGAFIVYRFMPIQVWLIIASVMTLLWYVGNYQDRNMLWASGLTALSIVFYPVIAYMAMTITDGTWAVAGVVAVITWLVHLIDNKYGKKPAGSAHGGGHGTGGGGTTPHKPTTTTPAPTAKKPAPSKVRTNKTGKKPGVY